MRGGKVGVLLWVPPDLLARIEREGERRGLRRSPTVLRLLEEKLGLVKGRAK